MAGSSIVGSLRVNLSLDSAQFTRGLNNVQSQMKRVGANMKNIGAGLSASVTAPLAGFGALTLKTAGNFEAAMNRVDAALQGSGANISALSEQARKLGSETSFSATEAANAIEVLAKNGVAAADIMGGALDASLSLAAAASADLGSAADVATDVMVNFGKSAADMPGVVNGVTGVLLQSKLGFDDYRLAIGQAGGVAGSLGVELEDFNAAIAATSSSFASGSDAGTSFKTFLQRLTPESESAGAAMKALGLEFYNSQGNMKGIAEVAETLKTSLSGLSEERQSAVLKDIFGSDAIRTALALAREGAAGINELKTSIGEASATDQAEARLQGMNGTLKQLSSAFEELQLVIADSGILDAFTSIVEGVTGLVRVAGELDPKLVKMGVAFAGLAAALGPFMIGAGLVVAAAGGPAFIIGAALVGLTAAAVAFWPEIKKATDSIAAFGAGVKKSISTLADDIVDAFKGIPEQMGKIGGDILEGLRKGISDKAAAVRDSVVGAVRGLISGAKDEAEVKSPSRVFRRIGGHLMDGLRLGIGDGVTGVTDTATGIADSVSGAFNGLFSGIIQEGKSFGQSLGDVMNKIADNLISGAISRISDAIGSVFSGGFGAKAHGSAIAGALGAAISAVPGFANGTDFAPGGMAWVGERGPELLNVPRGSQVIPNHELGGMGRGRQKLDVGVSIDGAGNLLAIIRDEAGRVVASQRQSIVGEALGKAPGYLNEQRMRTGRG